MNRESILRQLEQLARTLEKAQTEVGELMDAVSGDEDVATIPLVEFLAELEKPGSAWYEKWLESPPAAINAAPLAPADRQVLLVAYNSTHTRFHLEGTSPTFVPYVVIHQKPPPPSPGG